MYFLKKIKELQDQICALEEQAAESFCWHKAPVICEINGYRWELGPDSYEKMDWADAARWCKLVGGELPPRDNLLQAYLNEGIKPLFEESWYWSSTDAREQHYWAQAFGHGYQNTSFKANSYYVRAVRKVLI